MAIAIRVSEKRLEDSKVEFKKAIDRLEEEDLIIERNPKLISIEMNPSPHQRMAIGIN